MNRLRYGNAQFEIIERVLDVTRVGCKFSRVRSIEKQQHRSRAARAVVDGKLGHAITTDGLSDDQLALKAIDAAQTGAHTRLTFPSSVIAVEQADPALASMSEAGLRDQVEGLLRDIRQGQPEIVVEMELRRVRETVRLRNTNGGQIDLARAWLEGEAWVERHTGGEVLVVLDHFASARDDGSQREFARRMARRLRWARRPIQPQPGPQSVILSPAAFASLMRPMLFRLNGALAFQVGSRGSRRAPGFADRIGQQMFDARFSLYDDATLPDRPHSAPVDHEGTPSQRTPLIEHGIVNGFYHNLQSAALAETRSTGNGWRGLMEPPRPTLTNVMIEHGQACLPDMLKGLERGLLIDMVMGSDGATGLDGEFARTVTLAYHIENGRVAGYARGIGLGGNLYRSLQDIEALSIDRYWTGSVCAPYIQLGGVAVSV